MQRNVLDIDVAIANLRGTQSKMDTSVASLGNIRQGLAKIRGEFGSIWEGVSKEAYLQIIDKTMESAEKMEEQISRRSQQLEQAMEKYQEIETASQRHVDDLDISDIF